MKMLGSLMGGLMLGAGVFIASPALADIPPIGSCVMLGEACSEAGSNHDQPGTCQTSQCTRATPQGPMTYECKMCLATGEGGAGGAGSAGASGAESGGAGGAEIGGTDAGGAGAASTQGGSVANSTGGSSATGGTLASTGGTNATGGAANPTGGNDSTTGGSKGDGGSSGATNPGKDEDDSGCTIGNVGHERGVAGLMFALGMAGLLAARRRR